MEYTRRAVLGTTAAATVALAGCIGSDGDGGDGDTAPVEDGETTPDDETPTPDEDGDADDGTDSSDEDDGTTPDDEDGAEQAAVQISSHPDHGEILVGPDEMTLYMYDPDPQGDGESACYDDCADNWPPLTVDDDATASDGVTGELTTFERDDGSTQVAAGGWPLYYFAADEEPGDASGQGVGDVWWVLDSDGTPIRPDEDGDDDGSDGDGEDGGDGDGSDGSDGDGVDGGDDEDDYYGY